MITNNGLSDPVSDQPSGSAGERLNVAAQLASLGGANPISRAQAKRLLQRVAADQRLCLDFAGVASIGQAFVDEVFRVFANTHPQLELLPMNAVPEVQQMIRRAEVARDRGNGQL